HTLSLKIPASLEAELAAASAAEHVSKSALVRRALEAYLAQRKAPPNAPPTSALARAADLVGCFEGGPTDLASNPQHLADFGRV
ncbi:MAG: ribbon-helix-helix protein, CopG family, partial [Rhodocyclaceae bacterium]|nr:ribbon-helix-helix protein, CopG family [Rhodocyclaceae bacterium]